MHARNNYFEAADRVKAKQAAQRAKVVNVETGTCYLFYFTEADRQEVEKKIAKLLASGSSRHNDDGSVEWVHYEAVVDTSKQASEQYQWDSSGNKVLHHKVAYRRTLAGEISKIVIGRSYRTLE